MLAHILISLNVESVSRYTYDLWEAEEPIQFSRNCRKNVRSHNLLYGFREPCEKCTYDYVQSEDPNSHFGSF